MTDSFCQTLLSLSASAAARIDDRAATVLTHAVAPGIALGLVDRTGNILVRCYGERVVGTGRLVDEGTLFEIGSIGKSCTAIVIMQLAAEGTVDLHAPVKTYLPWFEIQSGYPPITLHHLLTHTSGLPGGDDPVPDARAEVWQLRNAATYAAPGVHFLYSNVGYKTLGLVLETILSKPYIEIVRDRIFSPLGMEGAHGAITSIMRSQLAQGYSSQFDDRPRLSRHEIVPSTWLETNTGDGCLAMTARDLSLYAGMLLQVSSGQTSSVLTAAQLAIMRNPHTSTPAEPAYGYALNEYGVDAEHDRFGHSGGMVGYGTQMTIDVAHGLAAVVLANGDADTAGLATFALEVIVAEQRGRPLPEIPPLPDPFDLTDLHDMAGAWRSATRSIEIERDGVSGLVLVDGENRIVLQTTVGMRGRGLVVVDAEDWGLFPLEIEYANSDLNPPDDNLQYPVKLHHGGESFWRPDAFPTVAITYPAEWDALVGHYRSYNPWRSNFRIVVREGRLTQIGSYGHASPMVEDGFRFWITDDTRPPSEWLQFEAYVNGEALIAKSNLGETFARFFTP